MKGIFKQVLLQSYLDMFIEKSKESEMLIASGRGLLNQAAKMINDSIYPLENKGLKVSFGHGDVRYWLITSRAKVDTFYHNEIKVVLGLACSPTEIKGRVRFTKKEAEIASELQKIWENNVNNGYFFESDKFIKKAEELRALSHHLECYKEFSYHFGMDDFYRKDDLLSRDYIFPGLTNNPYSEVCTRDLLPLSKLFGETE